MVRLVWLFQVCHSIIFLPCNNWATQLFRRPIPQWWIHYVNKMTLYRFILYHAVLQNSLFLLFYCYFLYLHNRYCVASILFVLCIFFCKSIIKLNQNLEPVSQIQFGLFNETCHSAPSCSLLQCNFLMKYRDSHIQHVQEILHWNLWHREGQLWIFWFQAFHQISEPDCRDQISSYSAKESISEVQQGSCLVIRCSSKRCWMGLGST